MIWDNKKVVVYEIAGDSSMIRAAGTFTSETHLVCLYQQNVYTLEPGKIQVRTFQVSVIYQLDSSLKFGKLFFCIVSGM